MFAICVKTGMPKMRNTCSLHACTEHLRHQFNRLFDNSSDDNIKGFVFNINVYRFISAAVNLLNDLLVVTYRLSSHARLEAFVIQTKLLGPKLGRVFCIGISYFFASLLSYGRCNSITAF